MTLRPYAEYQPAALPWLDQIPAHWEVRRLRQVVRFAGGGTPSKQVSGFWGGDIPWVSPKDMRSERIVSTIDAITSIALRASGLKRVPPGSVLVVVRSGILQRKLPVALAQVEVTLNQDMKALMPSRELRSDFLMHSLQGQEQSILAICSKLGATVESIEHGYFRSLPILLPPLDDQEAIAAFVAAFDVRINRLLGAKQRLLKLLAEQRQGIIQRAVTRGLDPGTRTKPSGVPWLGDIPEHWEVKKLKHLTRFENGFPFKPSEWKDDGIPIIRIQNLNGSEVFNYTQKKDVPAHLLIQPGDLLFAWSGNRGTSFGSFMWNREKPGYLNQHIFKLDGYSLHRGFFYFLLRAVTRHVEEQTTGIIGLVHVTKPELGSVRVPIPPPEEQVRIAAHLDEELAGIDAVVTKVRREIDLVREYRTRLVSDVVTGRLDVRGAELPPLPDGNEVVLEASFETLSSEEGDASPYEDLE